MCCTAGVRPARCWAICWARNWPRSTGRRTMYWRPLKPERFVRPVRWMVALLDHAILTVEFAGVRAANLTWGHRILHGDTPVTIDHPDDYVGVLEAAEGDGGCEAAATPHPQGAGSGDAERAWRPLARGRGAGGDGDAPDGVAVGGAGQLRSRISAVAGRSAGDSNAGSPEIFCRGECRGKAGTLFSGGAEYAPGREGHRCDPARARACAAGTLQRRALLLDGGSEDSAGRPGGDAAGGDLPQGAGQLRGQDAGESADRGKAGGSAGRAGNGGRSQGAAEGGASWRRPT